MKKKKIYEGKILGLSVYDGKIEGRKVKREMIEHRGAAAMLAFDEEKKIILVKQHRFPHGYVLEIPAGTLEKQEEPLKCAFRELEEETGVKDVYLEQLYTFGNPKRDPRKRVITVAYIALVKSENVELKISEIPTGNKICSLHKIKGDYKDSTPQLKIHFSIN